MEEAAIDATLPRLRPVRLKRREDRRLRAGHLWVFSNEIDTESTPMRLFEPGDLVAIRAANGKFIANGYINPHSLIAVRVLSRDAKRTPDRSMLVHRIRIALGLRQKLFGDNNYRLIYGEADFLPGLVVDRYEDVLVVQITTAGMERMKEDILAALTKVIKPKAVLWQNNSAIRKLEALESYVEPAMGDLPETVEIREGKVRFEVPLVSGQKTGWFYDQRLNRQRFATYANEARVLDVYSYIGGFGLQAKKHGAASVVCVDGSEPALQRLQANATRNRLSVETHCGNAPDVLRDLHQSNQQFDLIVLDPPAFIRRKRDIEAGTNAYRQIIQLAIQLMPREAYLMVCSCSYHMSEQSLLSLVQQSATHFGRHAQLLEAGGQAPDHPVHPAIPETRYLNALMFRVTSR